MSSKILQINAQDINASILICHWECESQMEAAWNEGGLCHSSCQEKKKTLIKIVQQCINLSLSTLVPSGNICISKEEKTGHCCIIIIKLNPDIFNSVYG